MKDSIAWGAIYIAGSVTGEMVKVGFTLNIESRKVKLNTTKYGGQNDWEIILHANCYDGGKVEKSIQSELSKYAIKKSMLMMGVHMRQVNSLNAVIKRLRKPCLMFRQKKVLSSLI